MRGRGWLDVVIYGSTGVRSGWRALAWMNAVSVPSAPLLVVLVAVMAAVRPEASLLLAIYLSGASTLPAWLGTWACVRWIDAAPLASVGLGGPVREAAREGLLGAALGLGMAAAALLPLWGLGYAEISWRGASPGWWALWAVGFVFAAAWEELAFRGYAFQWIARGIGRVGATLLFAVVFGLVHLTNPNIGWLGLANIVLAGVVLAGALFARRNLWLPIGVHWGWNAAQAVVFGVPVSGLSGEEVPSLLTTTLGGPGWVSGGGFGLEGSAAGVAALLAGGVVVWAARKRG